MGIFTNDSKKIRFAVVGLGYISQIAVLPAFAHCENCELTALVSGEPDKLASISKKYGIKNTYSYGQYEACLRSGLIDAVYIALPNTMHREYTVKAAAAGIHVICEKPMAVTQEECQEMIDACSASKVQLMVAYRLHFEQINMDAVQSVLDGKIGKPKMFTAAFGQSVKAGDIRTQSGLGGGALYDMGIYCLNAARYFFQSEPIRVCGMIAPNHDARFAGVDAVTGALLEFENGGIATFVTSISSGFVSQCVIVGEKGCIKLDPAFDFQLKLQSKLEIDGEEAGSQSRKSDHFAGELTRFADCILDGRDVSPSGVEGLADIRVIEAIFESASDGITIELDHFVNPSRPNAKNTTIFRPIYPPKLYKAQTPSQN